MRKHFLFAALLTILPLGASASASTIDDYTWHKRVLIVFAKDAASPELAKQRAWINDAKEGYSERELVPIQVIGQSVQGATDSADALRQKYGIAPGAFRVLLIGKDGGVKINSSEPIEAPRLFNTIDAMPMRRDESRGAPKS
ncbi:hypothetical protein BHUM_06297 [Candidatus Burkholderia humilis]|nr:hypothetical protein BHUM_06297 [Candidatus Burkholderia humilis]